MARNEGPTGPSGGMQSGTGLAPNVAGALSYVLGFITGIVFVVMEKDPFVRFHAYQSIFISVGLVAAWIALTILLAVLGLIPIIGPIFAFLGGLLLGLVIWLGGLVLWLVLILKAYQGARWKLPYVGDMAERYAAQ